MQLEMGMSTRRYLPASGTAGLARSLRQRKQSRALPAAHDDREHVAGVDGLPAGL